MVEATSSLALFALVWAVVCLLSGALVTDAMLRGQPNQAAADQETAAGLAQDDASA